MEKRNKQIDIHADDYALTVHTSQDMLECMKEGVLDSFSIICNTSSFDECMEMLNQAIPSFSFLPLISVHLNLVEGFALSEGLRLIAENGVMSLGWKGVWLMAFTGKRRQLKEELKKEIKAQIDRTWEVAKKCFQIAEENHIPYEQNHLRIDSHQHIHSIPIVWEALMEAIEENGYEVEYIRNPKEPLLPFIKEISLWKSYRPVNFIKNRILMLYSKENDSYCDRNHMQKMYMWGLVMSGKMDFERIKKIYPEMLKKTERDNRRLEILFHPGTALKEEHKGEIARESMEDFYLSDGRNIEKQTLLQIKNIVC